MRYQNRLLFKIFFVFAYFLSNSGWAQQAPFINVLNRKITSLNGKWNYIVDPYDNGFYDYRLQESSWGFFMNEKPKNKWDRIEYDFDLSPTLYVPGDWNSQKPELLYYEGTIWYKKAFNYTLPKNRRLFIYFSAANYESYVYLNGKKLGTHEGGFTPFVFEITNLVNDSNNFLIVKVNNQRKPENIPTINTDWWNYGGITRDVWLVEEDSIFVYDYSFYLADYKTNEIRGKIRLNNKVAGIKVNVKIPELDIKLSLVTDTNGESNFSVKPKKIDYWSPENPKLYLIQIQVFDNILSDKIGFRTVTTKGNSILLNGKPIFLRGISIHEENPMRGSRANGYDDARILLGWAKELGCNFVRLAHYPHNEYMTRMADSMGLLVWSEIPVYWTIHFNNDKTYRLAEQMLTDNIIRDRNRASIIIWSIGNETPVTEERTNFLKQLAEKARKLDHTRLISAALEVQHRQIQKENVYVVDDPLGEYLDVIACNQYIGWYDGLPDKCRYITWQCAYDKPFIFSELGAGALYGFHADSLTRWTEEYQQYFFEQQIAMLQKIPFLSGLSPWVLADFRSPRRQLPVIQDGWNRKGLVSEKGFKKKAFYVLKRWYWQIESKSLDHNK